MHTGCLVRYQLGRLHKMHSRMRYAANSNGHRKPVTRPCALQGAALLSEVQAAGYSAKQTDERLTLHSVPENDSLHQDVKHTLLGQGEHC